MKSCDTLSPTMKFESNKKEEKVLQLSDMTFLTSSGTVVHLN